MPRKKTLYEQTYYYDNLKKAWDKIYQNGINSSSKDTINQIKEFKEDEHNNIKKIRRELQKELFKFDNIKGIAPKKKSGGRRPLVLSSPKIRVVQRCILNI